MAVYPSSSWYVMRRGCVSKPTSIGSTASDHGRHFGQYDGFADRRHVLSTPKAFQTKRIAKILANPRWRFVASGILPLADATSCALPSCAVHGGTEYFICPCHPHLPTARLALTVRAIEPNLLQLISRTCKPYSLSLLERGLPTPKFARAAFRDEARDFPLKAHMHGWSDNQSTSWLRTLHLSVPSLHQEGDVVSHLHMI